MKLKKVTKVVNESVGPIDVGVADEVETKDVPQDEVVEVTEEKKCVNEAPTVAERGAEVLDEIEKSDAALDSEEYLKDIFDDVEEVNYRGDIEKALDDALEANLAQRYAKKPSFLNVLLVGDAGTGKTARVEAWAEENNIHLVKMLTSAMDQGDFSVMAPNFETLHANKLTTDEFDILDEPNTVLFLDEYNRADFMIRGTLLTLINNHEVPASGKDDNGNRISRKKFNNFLFTIAAINPAEDGTYNVQKLDAAELGRVGRVDVKMDNKSTRLFLYKHFGEITDNPEVPENIRNLNRWKRQISELLLADNSKFEFDNKQDIKNCNKKGVASLNPRSLTLALDSVVRPTIKDFEEKFKRYSNPDKWDYVLAILQRKKFDDLAKIDLDAYEEVDDKATQALKKPTQSELIKKIQPEERTINTTPVPEENPQVNTDVVDTPQEVQTPPRATGGLLGKINRAKNGNN